MPGEPQHITAEDVLRTYRTESAELLRPVVARFVLQNQHEIRIVAKARLFSTMRSVCDTDELMATVLRRIDQFVHRGMFAPKEPGDVMALVRTVAHNTATSKIRLTQRARAMVREDGQYAQMLLDRLNQCPDDDDAATLITRLMLAIPTWTDRQIFSLRLRGTTHKVAAQAAGITEATARKRWSATMDLLQSVVKTWES